MPALALPVLMTSALIGPPAGWAWQTCTGAAQKRLRVNTPATLVPGAKREHGQIASVGFADAGLGNADFNAGNRKTSDSEGSAG